MIAKMKKGTGFRGVLAYALKSSKNPEIIASTATSENPKEVAREFSAIARRSTRTSKPVAHLALSVADGERLSDEDWAKVVDAVVTELGAEVYVAVRHADTAHDHIHIVMSRVNLSGKAWDDSNDRRRIRKVCTTMEIELGITRTKERAKRHSRSRSISDPHGVLYTNLKPSEPSRGIER